MLQYSENTRVFSKRLKLSLPRSGSLKLSGREFQSDGPATEKARGPSVLSRHRGTTVLRRRTLVHRDLRGVIGRASRCRPTLRRRELVGYILNSPGTSERSSECKSRDKPRSYLWVLETTRAAAFSAIINTRRHNLMRCWVHVHWAPDASELL